MKEKHKTLLLSMLISIILVGSMVTIWFLSVHPAMEPAQGGYDETVNIFQNIIIIVAIGGFCSSTIFFYIIIDALKKNKK
jgi:hypothetical protein